MEYRGDCVDWPGNLNRKLFCEIVLIKFILTINYVILMKKKYLHIINTYLYSNILNV